MPLIVNPEAEADLVEAKSWYDSQRTGLGDDFLLCLEETLQRLRRMPELYAKTFQDLRLALVRRFPFAVIYRIDDNQITVIAIYHTSRDPRSWQQRA
jgi:plasmid stabilization system protein ParE